VLENFPLCIFFFSKWKLTERKKERKKERGKERKKERHRKLK
jgi:hypothetical protein